MDIKRLTIIAFLTALSTLAVGYLRIPSPYGGIIHFGDSVIFIVAVFFGPFAGAFVGGVGHAVANLIFGPQIFAPWTLVIKALMGFTVGAIAYKKEVKSLRLWIALILAWIILLVGYFIATIVLFNLGDLATSPVPLVFALSNATQWVASIIAFLMLLPIIKKILKRL